MRAIVTALSARVGVPTDLLRREGRDSSRTPYTFPRITCAGSTSSLTREPTPPSGDHFREYERTPAPSGDSWFATGAPLPLVDALLDHDSFGSAIVRVVCT